MVAALTFIPAILRKLIQVRVSFIGWKSNAVVKWGKEESQYKVLEISIALFTFGVRVTLRI